MGDQIVEPLLGGCRILIHAVWKTLEEDANLFEMAIISISKVIVKLIGKGKKLKHLSQEESNFTHAILVAYDLLPVGEGICGINTPHERLEGPHGIAG